MIATRWLLPALGALRRGDAGAFAAYKAAMFRLTPSADTARRLEALASPVPDIGGDALRRSPVGSLGHAWHSFLARNELHLIAIPENVRCATKARHALGLRYALLHDAFHVLLGFDASWPGELGVWSFVAAQGYSPAYARAARTARWYYRLRAPGPALDAARQRGRALAERAAARNVCVIAEPLEARLGEPLSAVRSSLALDAAGEPWHLRAAVARRPAAPGSAR